MNEEYKVYYDRLFHPGWVSGYPQLRMVEDVFNSSYRCATSELSKHPDDLIDMIAHLMGREDLRLDEESQAAWAHEMLETLHNE